MKDKMKQQQRQMKVTCADLNRGSGLIVSKARKRPVILERYKKPWLVMLAYDEYERLKSSHELLSTIENQSLSEFKDLFVQSIHRSKLKCSESAIC